MRKNANSIAIVAVQLTLWTLVPVCEARLHLVGYCSKPNSYRQQNQEKTDPPLSTSRQTDPNKIPDILNQEKQESGSLEKPKSTGEKTSDAKAEVDKKAAAEKTAEEEKKKAEAAKKAEEKKPDPLLMTAKWNNGMELQTADKNFRVHVGGRYQMDSSWYSVDPAVQSNINTPYGDGIDFRRARFRVDGTLYQHLEWAAEVDFVNAFRVRNQPITATNPGFTDNAVSALTDFWWQFNDMPKLGSIRIGQQKEPIGFEHLVSSRFLPLMERSYNQDTFYGGVFNGFNPGIQAFRNYGPDQNGVVQLGIFKPTNNVFAFNTGDGDYSVTGRLTRLLSYGDEGRVVTHFGISARQATAVSQSGVPGRIQTFRTRDAIRSGLSTNWPVPAGIALYGSDMQWLNTEFVVVRGPWTLQSEYLVSNMHDARANFGDAPDPNVTYHGGYIQLFRFLTDDFDNYNKKTGVFDRVKPLHAYRMPMGEEECAPKGIGAIQVGARYNYLDLNNSGLNGGILHNLTAGVNWFLNPNMKLQGNYIFTYRDVSATANFPAGSGWIHGFGGRIAIDF